MGPFWNFKVTEHVGGMLKLSDLWVMRAPSLMRLRLVVTGYEIGSRSAAAIIAYGF